MNKVLLNQKEVSKRKELHHIQKQTKREYGRGKSILKAKIGKLFVAEENENDYVQTRTLGNFSTKEVLDVLREVQLTGMSGNGFLVSEKIENVLKSETKILIVNGVECEPGLLHDKWLIENCWEQIESGIQVLQQVFQFDRCMMAYSMKRKERRRKEITEKYEICHVPLRYPMGEERCLIKHLLGKEIGKDEYPVEHGILVLNVQTVFQIYCILLGEYQNGRYITTANLDTGKAEVVYVKRGSKIKQRLEEIYGENTSISYFAGSGIMSAHDVTDEDEFSDLICFAAIGNRVELTNEHACKGCGKCNRKCPVGVDVREIVRRREKDMHADISGLGMEKCIHCGCCTFFCRAEKNTLEYFD